EAELAGTLDERVLGFAHCRDAGEIAFDVGREHGHARTRKTLGKDLQGHGLAGAGRAGDETVPVAVVQRQVFGLFALADEDFAVLIETRHPWFLERAAITRSRASRGNL